MRLSTLRLTKRPYQQWAIRGAPANEWASTFCRAMSGVAGFPVPGHHVAGGALAFARLAMDQLMVLERLAYALAHGLIGPRLGVEAVNLAAIDGAEY